jgi:predicted XRE-type DNA-binding protein
VAKGRKTVTRKRSVGEIPVTRGSGNVFADLWFKDAEELQMKAELTRQLHNRIKALRLTQVQAGTRLGIGQPDVSKLMNGRYTGFSVERLFALLNALAVDVDITLRPRRAGKDARGTLRVTGSTGNAGL